VKEQEGGWEILFGAKHYVFPREDVIALPIDNSTAERLAEYICQELLRGLAAHNTANLHTITVGVEEAPTQMAYYRTAFPQAGQPRS